MSAQAVRESGPGTRAGSVATAQPGVGLPGAGPEPTAALISCEGLALRLGGQPVLVDVDLQVHAGEVVALVGPNGAGKSTLLAALAGDLEPEQGRVLLGEYDLTGVPVAERARARAVQVQEARLSFAFRAEEVVRMGRAPWRGTRFVDDDDAVVAHALRTSEIEHLAGRLFPTLSGGEKARTAFARAVGQETAVLMLDEPTAALDIRHQERLLAEVRERAAAGVGVVVVLHDLTLAAAYADRIVLLADGRVRANGTPRDVLTPELLTEVYRYPIAVVEHEDSGALVVLPLRDRHSPQKEES
jgi:iron complex transport system ATP-binding protein